MGRRRIDERIAVGSATLAALTVMLLAACSGADAAEPTPGSGEGGSPGPNAPAGVKVSTALPSRITVDNTTGRTSGLTATVSNGADKDTAAIVLAIVGFDGLEVTGVEGCTAIPAASEPEGSNGGYDCAVGKLAAGQSRTYTVEATYDLTRKGRICLPVTPAEGGTLLWQQGPVPFGTSEPSPNAPDTPLLLGTENVPLGPPTSPTADPSASPGTLPVTGPAERTVPLAVGGSLLLAAGGTGLWLTRRRRT